MALITFKDLKFKPHPTGPGLMARMNFPNGYGVSVVRFKLHDYTELLDLAGIGEQLKQIKGIGGMLGRPYASYTNDETEWEVAILKNGAICYSTPIADDVIGYLSSRKVTNIMKKVQKLRKKK